MRGSTALAALWAAVGLALLLSAASATPVRVELYSEALCPYCANYTSDFLAPLFANKLINHVQLDLIPYGNARTNPSTGEVECQHGPVECQLNKVLSCALAFNPIQDDWFPFVACIEEAATKGMGEAQVEDVTQACAVHTGLLASKIMDCYKGDLGDSLQRLAAQRTESLRPPHQWVPWVVVNGIAIMGDEENLMTYICVALNGRERPKVCLDIPRPAAALRTAPQAAAPAAPRKRAMRAGFTNTPQQQQQLPVASARSPQRCWAGHRSAPGSTGRAEAV